MTDAFLLIIAKLLAGWLIADLLGGIVHWLEDRVLTERIPFLRGVIAANRLHHRSPLAFFHHGIVARNATTWATALAASLVWLLVFGPSWTWIAATIGGMVSSSVHHLAHRPRPASLIIRVLQEVGLLQSAAHHAGHHRPGAARRYCVLTALVNPLIDGIGLWAMLERALARLGVPLVGDTPTPAGAA